jgi:hypothetical protein
MIVKKGPETDRAYQCLGVECRHAAENLEQKVCSTPPGQLTKKDDLRLAAANNLRMAAKSLQMLYGEPEKKGRRRVAENPIYLACNKVQ